MTRPNSIPSDGSKDMDVLSLLWGYTKGKAWEPKDPRGAFFDRMIAAGYLKRVDGRCGFEAFKDSMIAWTDAGRAAMASREPVAA